MELQGRVLASEWAGLGLKGTARLFPWRRRGEIQFLLVLHYSLGRSTLYAYGGNQ